MVLVTGCTVYRVVVFLNSEIIFLLHIIRKYKQGLLFVEIASTGIDYDGLSNISYI